MKLNKKLLLIVLDGFGINKNYRGNAVYKAKMPFYDSLKKENTYLTLGASEEYVGLPKKQLGSSEVGHSTIGAGRKLLSEIVRINKAIDDGSFYENPLLNKQLSKTKNSLHLIGLVSDGGVHSHISHLFALLDVIKRYPKIKNVYVHVITDGRDVSPTSSSKYIKLLEKKLLEQNLGQIASVSGRYYGMDRDNNWDRQKKVYDMLVNNKAPVKTNVYDFIKESYKKGVTDEFLEPTLFVKEATIKEKDTVIFFNFRSDRAREFTRMFVDNKFSKFATKKLKLKFVTLTEFDKKIKDAIVLFPPQKQLPGLGQIISKEKHKQLRVAETEKFAHVTYFFNLGQEYPNKKEDRILVPSPSTITYDQKPEMSAKIITKELIDTFNKDYLFTLVNFANPDMVGHTGNIDASVKALEVVDYCLKIIFSKISLDNTDVIVTSDHGNVDEMLIDDKVCTSHSLNKVPFILISKDKHKKAHLENASLANIAPTVLKLLSFEIPEYMEKPLIDE